MAYPNLGAIEQHADHIESIGLRLLAVPVDPHHRRTLQLLALPIVDCLDWPAEFRAFSSFDFYEGHGSIPLDYQINVAMPITESPLDDPPAAPPKPSLRDSLSEFPERLPGR